MLNLCLQIPLYLYSGKKIRLSAMLPGPNNFSDEQSTLAPFCLYVTQQLIHQPEGIWQLKSQNMLTSVVHYN